jgi:hypothetical protein
MSNFVNIRSPGAGRLTSSSSSIPESGTDAEQLDRIASSFAASAQRRYQSEEEQHELLFDYTSSVSGFRFLEDSGCHWGVRLDMRSGAPPPPSASSSSSASGSPAARSNPSGLVCMCCQLPIQVGTNSTASSAVAFNSSTLSPASLASSPPQVHLLSHAVTFPCGHVFHQVCVPEEACVTCFQRSFRSALTTAKTARAAQSEPVLGTS